MNSRHFVSFDYYNIRYRKKRVVQTVVGQFSIPITEQKTEFVYILM